MLATVGSTVTVVVGALGTIGITAGVITALLRNQEGLTILAIALVGVGVLLGVGSALFVERPILTLKWRQREIRWRPRRASIASIASVGIGVSILVLLAANSLKTTNRPVITTTVTSGNEGTFVLDTSVTAAGMTTDERYYIKVEQFNSADPRVGGPMLFYTYAGAGADGKLDYRFKLIVPYNPAFPSLGISAQLQHEGDPPGETQNCGLLLPNAPPSTTSAAPAPTSRPPTPTSRPPTPTVTTTTTPRPTVPEGTTCAVVVSLPAPTSTVRSS